MPNKTEPVISLIVPVYNTEAYLRGALDSALSQGVDNMEIICVDDGSTDGSATILEEYRKKHPNITVLTHPENRSLIQARKTGVAASKGQYVMHLDSDDELCPNAVKTAVAAIRKHKVDVLQFGAILVPEKDISKERFDRLKQSIRIHPHRINGNFAILDACFLTSLFTWSIWDKIVSGDVCRKAFSSLGDDYINTSEDILGFALTAYFAQSYFGIRHSLYKYRIGSGITTKSSDGLDSFRISVRNIRAADALKRFVATLSPEEEIGFRPSLHKIEAHAARTRWNHLVRTLTPLAVRKEAWEIMLDAFGGRASFFRRLFYSDIPPEELLFLCNGVDLQFSAKTRTIKTVALHYTRFFNGGVERVLLFQMDLFHRMGYRVVFLSVQEPEPEKDYPLPDYVKRIVVPAPRVHPCELDSSLFSKHAERLENVLKEENIDLLYAHNAFDSDLLADVLICKAICDIPILLHFHGVFSLAFAESLSYLFSFVPIARYCDHVITLSSVNRLYFEAQGVSSSYLSNPPTFSRQTTPGDFNPETKTILFSGRISPEKRPFDVIRIFHAVRQRVPDAKLRILGDGDDETIKQAMRTMIDEFDLRDSVEFCGYQKDVIPFYQNVAVMLSTSLFEGFPMVFSEAKAFGIPIVCYDMPYLEMLRTPEEGVISVPQEDTLDAAEAIAGLLLDVNRRRLLNTQALASFEKYAATNFDVAFSDLFHVLESGKKPFCQPHSEDLRILLQTLCYHFSLGNEKVKARQNEQMWNGLLDAIKSSRSYRLGRLLTWGPRMVRNTFRCARAYGIAETARRIVRKIRAIPKLFLKK